MMPDMTGMDFYISAFIELGTCRQTAFGVGPIPFTAIVEYSKLYEVEDINEFIYVIRRMDKKYMELNKEKGASNATGKPGKRN